MQSGNFHNNFLFAFYKMLLLIVQKVLIAEFGFLQFQINLNSIHQNKFLSKPRYINIFSLSSSLSLSVALPGHYCQAQSLMSNAQCACVYVYTLRPNKKLLKSHDFQFNPWEITLLLAMRFNLTLNKWMANCLLA